MGKLIIFVLIFALIITGAVLLYTKLGSGFDVADAMEENGGEDITDAPEDAAATPRTEPKAADFTAYDADGKAHKLSDYLGKPIVLNFWASWCGPCQSEMPGFNDKYLENSDEVVFLMVNMTGGRESVSSAKNFVEKNGYEFPVLFDTEYDAAYAYNVVSLPTTYFIDRDGYVVGQKIGVISEKALQTAIDRIK